MWNVRRRPFSQSFNLRGIRFYKAWSNNSRSKLGISRKTTLLNTISHLQPGSLSLFTYLTRSAHERQRAYKLRKVESEALGNDSAHGNASNMCMRDTHDT